MVCKMKWIIFYEIHIFTNLGYGLCDYDKFSLKTKFTRYPQSFNEMKNLNLVYRFQEPLRPELRRNYEYIDYDVYHLPKETIRYKYSIKKKSTKKNDHDFTTPKSTSKDATQFLYHNLMRLFTKNSTTFGKLNSSKADTEIWQQKHSHKNLPNITLYMTSVAITTIRETISLQDKTYQNKSTAFVNYLEPKKNSTSIQKSNQITLKLTLESNSTHDKNNIFKAEDEYSESNDYNIVKEKLKNKKDKEENQDDKNGEDIDDLYKSNIDENSSILQNGNINDEDINDTSYEFGTDKNQRFLHAEDPDYTDEYFYKNNAHDDKENKKEDVEEYSNSSKKQNTSALLVNDIYSTHYIAHQVSPALPYIQPNYPNQQPVIPLPIAVPSPVPILGPVVSHNHLSNNYLEMPFYGEPEVYFLPPSPIVPYFDYPFHIHQRFSPSLPLSPPLPPPPPAPLPLSPSPLPLPPPVPPGYAPNNFVPQSNLALNNMAPVFNLDFDINTGGGGGGGKKSKMISPKPCDNESCGAPIIDLTQEQSIMDYNEQKSNNTDDIFKPKQNESVVEYMVTENALNEKNATNNLIKHIGGLSDPSETTIDDDNENASVPISKESENIVTFNKTLRITGKVSESTTLVYNTSIGIQEFINKFDFRNSFYENVNLTRQKLNEENRSLIDSLSVSDLE